MAGAIAAAGSATARRQAVELVGETAGNAQAGIEGKQAGQAGRAFRVDPLARTSQSPRTLQAIAGRGRRAHCLCWCVVQEAPEGALAEPVVPAGEQDELVPGVIHRLRRHGHHALAGLPANLEIIEQTGQDLGALTGRQLRAPRRQSPVQVLLVRIIVDIDRSPRP